ncbi:antitoxin PrlF [Candidatus Magnetomoraceae bacterium gMMP-15]
MPQLSLYRHSKLTSHYQTTIPNVVREVLGLEKHDKICYTVHSDGKVLISRAEKVEEDPVLANFLNFLANDMVKNPKNVKEINSDLRDRIQSLVSNVEIDLDSPLSEEDE